MHSKYLQSCRVFLLVFVHRIFIIHTKCESKQICIEILWRSCCCLLLVVFASILLLVASSGKLLLLLNMTVGVVVVVSFIFVIHSCYFIVVVFVTADICLFRKIVPIAYTYIHKSIEVKCIVNVVTAILWKCK